MPKIREPIDDLIDAHVWMRRQEARQSARKKGLASPAASPKHKIKGKKR
jgi:hypothetical protein